MVGFCARLIPPGSRGVSGGLRRLGSQGSAGQQAGAPKKVPGRGIFGGCSGENQKGRRGKGSQCVAVGQLGPGVECIGTLQCSPYVAAVPCRSTLTGLQSPLLRLASPPPVASAATYRHSIHPSAKTTRQGSHSPSPPPSPTLVRPPPPHHRHHRATPRHQQLVGPVTRSPAGRPRRQHHLVITPPRHLRHNTAPASWSAPSQDPQLVGLVASAIASSLLRHLRHSTSPASWSATSQDPQLVGRVASTTTSPSTRLAAGSWSASSPASPRRQHSTGIYVAGSWSASSDPPHGSLQLRSGGGGAPLGGAHQGRGRAPPRRLRGFHLGGLGEGAPSPPGD